MSALEVLGIDNVLFAVGDFDAARRFYADTLGLTPKFEVPGMGLAGFRLGPEEPALLVRTGGGPPRLCWKWPTPGPRRRSCERGAWSRRLSPSRCRRAGPWSSPTRLETWSD